jgi:uncharacterized protein (DUF488 family)
MNSLIKLFTVGFAGKNAEEFFTLLKSKDVKRIIDIRRSNTSQLAGYTKKEDLRYFLRTIDAIDYVHMLELAPSEELFKKNKNKEYKKEEFELLLREEIKERNIKEILKREDLENACLLCSEKDPKECHRSIVARYLKEIYGDLVIEDI